MVTLDSNLTENNKLISEIFSQWRDTLNKDSFTDLKILCKDDWFGGVSVHKAVLASISPFMASILSDGRDETTIMMPDVDKDDLLYLVRILYGNQQEDQTPSTHLLNMLGIKELPKLIQKPTTFTRKCFFFFIFFLTHATKIHVHSTFYHEVLPPFPLDLLLVHIPVCIYSKTTYFKGLEANHSVLELWVTTFLPD